MCGSGRTSHPPSGSPPRGRAPGGGRGAPGWTPGGECSRAESRSRVFNELGAGIRCGPPPLLTERRPPPGQVPEAARHQTGPDLRIRLSSRCGEPPPGRPEPASDSDSHLGAVSGPRVPVSRIPDAPLLRRLTHRHLRRRLRSGFRKPGRTQAWEVEGRINRVAQASKRSRGARTPRTPLSRSSILARPSRTLPCHACGSRKGPARDRARRADSQRNCPRILTSSRPGTGRTGKGSPSIATVECVGTGGFRSCRWGPVCGDPRRAGPSDYDPRRTDR